MRKSKFTIAKEITKETKEKVLKRQKGLSISGVQLTPYNVEFHHYVYRSNSGVGYEWNIVALTSEEHRAIHDKQDIKVYGKVRYTYDEFITLIGNHLKLKYYGWTLEKCKYHKFWEIKDYEIKCNY